MRLASPGPVRELSWAMGPRPKWGSCGTAWARFPKGWGFLPTSEWYFVPECSNCPSGPVLEEVAYDLVEVFGLLEGTAEFHAEGSTD